MQRENKKSSLSAILTIKLTTVVLSILFIVIGCNNSDIFWKRAIDNCVLVLFNIKLNDFSSLLYDINKT